MFSMNINSLLKNPNLNLLRLFFNVKYYITTTQNHLLQVIKHHSSSPNKQNTRDRAHTADESLFTVPVSLIPVLSYIAHAR